MKKFLNYLKEARAELAKVNWPTRQQAMRLTVVVVIFTVAVSMFIGSLDYVFSLGLQKLILKG